MSMALNPPSRLIPEFATPSKGMDWLVIVFLIGIYTHVDIFYQGSPVFSAPVCGICGLWLLARNSSQISAEHLKYLTFFNLASLLTIILNSSFTTFFIEYLKAYLQLSYSMVVSYGLLLGLLSLTRAQLTQMFFWAVVLILVGCALEVLTPFSMVSDAFRYTVYDERFIYGAKESNNDRDLNSAGIIRPKLFTEEPSNVAKFFAVSLMSWYLLSKKASRLIIFGAFLFGEFLVLRSSTLIAAVAILLVPSSNSRSESDHPSDASDEDSVIGQIVKRFMLLAVGLLMGFLVIYMSGRDVLSSDSGDESTQARIFSPYKIMVEALSNYPVFGVGVGGTELCETEIFDEILAITNNNYKRALTFPINTLMCNAFCQYWMFYGFVTGILGMYFLWKFSRSVSDQPFGAFILLYAISNFQGAYVGPRLWTYFIILLGVTAVVSRPETTLQSDSAIESPI